MCVVQSVHCYSSVTVLHCTYCVSIYPLWYSPCSANTSPPPQPTGCWWASIVPGSQCVVCPEGGHHSCTSREWSEWLLSTGQPRHLWEDTHGLSGQVHSAGVWVVVVACVFMIYIAHSLLSIGVCWYGPWCKEMDCWSIDIDPYFYRHYFRILNTFFLVN